MDTYSKIRAAIENATGGRPSNIAAALEALAALAELERAAAEPVAWRYEFENRADKWDLEFFHGSQMPYTNHVRGITPLYAAPTAPVAELERAAAEPVAWMWNDELGIPHASAGAKRPVWLESSASAEYIRQANLRPLYTTPPPAPVAEMREPTPQECERISMAFYDDEALVDRDHSHLGGDMFRAVRAVMWPKGGES